MNEQNLLVALSKNKKGDMTVLLFVVLVLVMSSATLFSFINSSGKVEAQISDARFIENLYSDRDLAEFYLIGASEITIVKIYDGFVESDSYVGNPNYNSEHQVRFGVLNPGLNKEFRDNFIEEFKTEFSRYDFEEDYLKNLKEIIAVGSFDVVFDGEVLTMSINNWELNDFLNNINVTYSPRIYLKFDMMKMGLHGFEEIYDVKESCKGDENVKSCFEELVNFEVEVAEKGEDIFVEFTSKKDFLIGGEFRNINFGFVLK